LIELKKMMSNLSEKYILIIIPKSQFCEQELNGVRNIFQQNGANVVVLSKSGQEALGANKERFQPDGMIVDWNKHIGIENKYHAVILVGGKGAKKSLWDDPIVPQILTDHYRFGSVIGAMGAAIVVLVRASLVTGEVPIPEDDATYKELENLNAVCVDVSITSVENVVLGQGGNSVHQFSQKIIELIGMEEIF
jgi:4-methyl-5(b-hydroxyethyl)-thiazole monophosphate biosynthesis